MALHKPALAFIALVAIGLHAQAEKITALGNKPQWTLLDAYQHTITRDEFMRLLTNVYAPDGAWKPWFQIDANSVLIKKSAASAAYYRLHFASAADTRPAPRYWTPASALPPAALPLTGVSVALDPGHLGGKWAKMEERWFQIGNTKPVTEGDMTLSVAKLLSARLEALGAEVFLVRSAAGPVTDDRPADLRRAAHAELKRLGVKNIRSRYSDPNDPGKRQSIQWQSELLFYRLSEIHHRALLVNRQIKPDVVVCLHFNAEEWHDPKNPTFVDRNHLHLLVNGCYSAAELSFDDTRFEMLRKLLGRSFREEYAISQSVANSLAAATSLPPYEYRAGKARRSTQNPYVWTRNLLANRLYRCPVVYCEPYVMNSQPVFDRIQLGDYEGEENVGGVMRKSIYREYADAVADGLADYYKSARRD
jgi:N-acetylmuramoyl-L-alanine amidase